MAGGLLFASGQIALDPATGELVGETAAEQAEQVMRNVGALLADAGARGGGSDGGGAGRVAGNQGAHVRPPLPGARVRATKRPDATWRNRAGSGML